MKILQLGITFFIGCAMTPLASLAEEQQTTENTPNLREPYAIFSWDVEPNKEIDSLEDEINNICRIWLENDCREG